MHVCAHVCLMPKEVRKSINCLGIELQTVLSHLRWVQLLAAELSFQHLLYFYFFG